MGGWPVYIWDKGVPALTFVELIPEETCRSHCHVNGYNTDVMALLGKEWHDLQNQ